MNHLQLTLSLASLVLASCASPDSGPSAPGSESAPGELSRVNSQVTQAVTTPLSDLNLVRANIPKVLASAQKAPYAVPSNRECAALAAEVQALDAALGADLDTVPTASNPSLIDRGTDALGNAAVGAVRGAAEGVIPYRGWVRKLSGAEKYSKEVASAIAAGTIRRAYLKGLGQAAACPVPAAPRHLVAGT